MTRVHAIRVHRTGGPEELRYEEIELGAPGSGEALVRQTAIGLNFTDIHFRTGRYPLPGLPQTGWEETTLLAAAMNDEPERFVGDVMAANLALAGRIAAQPDLAGRLGEPFLAALRKIYRPNRVLSVNCPAT